MKNSTKAKTESQPESDVPKLGAPAVRALTAAGYTRLEQFTKLRVDQIKDLHGVGPNAINRLRAALKEKGWSFADEV